MKLSQLAKMHPKDVRELIRKGEVDLPTSGMSEGYLQANLAILPKKYAYDFLLFAQRNPKPCPILEVLDEGSPLTKIMADGADIRTDVPRYRIYKNGEFVEEVKDLKDVKRKWRCESNWRNARRNVFSKCLCFWGKPLLSGGFTG